MAPPFPPSDSSQFNKHFAVSPPLVSEILSAPPTFLCQKTHCLCLCLCLCLSVCAVAVDLKASKRTKNATGAVVKDNSFIVGLNPEAGSPEGWHWRYNGSP